MAFRYDRGTLRSPQTLPGGRLRVDAALTRSGVFEYRNPDGSLRREWRPEDEVFKAASLATLVGAPFTDDHPSEGAVDTENADKLARGSVVGEPRRDGALVIGTLVVTSKPVITKMREGKVEVSCGYEADIDETPGVTPTGERYDCVQRNIQYNHVALVAVGRAGPQARVRMDSASQVIPTDAQEHSMDFEKKFLEQVALTAAEKTRADTAEQVATAQRQRADRAEGERDAAKAAQVTAEKQRTDAADSMHERVRARVELEGVGSRLLGDDFKPAMSDGDIKRAIVKRVDAVDIAADKSADYLEGFYSSAVKRADKAAGSAAALRGVVDSPDARQRVDANDAPPEVAARIKMIKEQNAPSKMGE